MNKEKKQARQNSFNFFWNEGNGNCFLLWANGSRDGGKFINYDKYFSAYDEKVDQLVKEWLENGSFHQIIKSLDPNDGQIKSSENFTKLFEEMKNAPVWLDDKLIQYGAELSQRSGLTGLMVLRNFALMGGYYFSNLTKPLVATGSLDKGATLRLHNTLQFWVDVSRSGNDAQKSRLKSCLKTRLVHSASRLMILKKYPAWDTEELGVPINMADMVATNIAFSLYFLYGLDRLNFHFTEEEEAGIFHLWKYVTWLLGVPEEILPNNRKEAVEFFYYWTGKQGLPDNDSIILANSLMNENTPLSIFKFNVIKRNMGYIHKSISHFLLDTQTITALEIPDVRLKNMVPNALKIRNQLLSNTNRNEQISNGNAEQYSVLNDYRK